MLKLDLPSFIVTLGNVIFILRGATLAITRLITGRTQVPGLRVLIEDDPLLGYLQQILFNGYLHWLGSIEN